MFHRLLDHFQEPPYGGRPNTKPVDHNTLNAHNYCWFVLFYQVRGPARMETRWSNIWMGARSHMASHYTWGSVTTLHDCGGVLGRPLNTFFWALTISWSRLLACVWSGPLKRHFTHKTKGPWPLQFKSSHRSKRRSPFQVHFTHEGEGLKPKEDFMDE
jgi:hypothetical protein